MKIDLSSPVVRQPSLDIIEALTPATPPVGASGQTQDRTRTASLSA